MSSRRGWRKTALCATSMRRDIRTDLQRLKRDSEALRQASSAAPRQLRWNLKTRICRRRPSLLAVSVAALLFLLFRSQPAKLTTKDTLVIADFINTTGDPVFDGTLRQGSFHTVGTIAFSEHYP